jgi:hypothetical protein
MLPYIGSNSNQRKKRRAWGAAFVSLLGYPFVLGAPCRALFLGFLFSAYSM